MRVQPMKFAVSVFGNQPMPQIVERVKMIESLGFDAVWFGDLQRICREVYVEMTACALNTSRITLGIGVTMPTTRHASVTASAFASLHDLAPGRIRAGISTGDSGVRSIGRRPESIASLESYIRQVKGLLQNEVVEFDEGGSAKLAWLQSPTDIPIYVAATGPGSPVQQAAWPTALSSSENETLPKCRQVSRCSRKQRHPQARHPPIPRFPAGFRPASAPTAPSPDASSTAPSAS